MKKEPVIVFENRIGGPDIDSSNDLLVTTDGGFLIAGYTYSKGEGKGDAYLIKCNAAGEIEWDKTYGGPENDQVYTLAKTKDGGYVAAGKTESYGSGKRDVYIIKVDAGGNLEWEKVYGGEQEDEANCVIQTTDNGYLTAGMTYSKGAGSGDIYILKLDTNGSLEWEKTFGGAKKDYAAHVEKTKDRGYIVCGSGGEKTDCYVLKLDQEGNIQWEKFIGSDNFDLANCIIPVSRGGYIMAGMTQPEAGKKVDIYVVKLTDKGDIEWEKSFAGKDHSGAQNIKETMDKGYIVTGSTKNTKSGRDNAFLIKLNSRGESAWEEHFGGEDIAYGNAVVEKSRGIYSVTGYILETDDPSKGDYSIYFFSYKRK
ncbi:MAG: hypothetical protein JXB88_23550 [Spirochaetales bacterium]|nr:hypothetical protein [Spirochaetales bacterium]